MNLSSYEKFLICYKRSLSKGRAISSYDPNYKKYASGKKIPVRYTRKFEEIELTIRDISYILRLRANLNQRELSQHMGCSAMLISHAEGPKKTYDKVACRNVRALENWLEPEEAQWINKKWGFKLQGRKEYSRPMYYDRY
jgi:hypothetical protein